MLLWHLLRPTSSLRKSSSVDRSDASFSKLWLLFFLKIWLLVRGLSFLCDFGYLGCWLMLKGAIVVILAAGRMKNVFSHYCSSATLYIITSAEQVGMVLTCFVITTLLLQVLSFKNESAQTLLNELNSLLNRMNLT